MIIVVAVCVAGLTAALTGAVSPLPGMRFLPGGHWVYNGVLQAVFHIDGATANIDAQAGLASDRDSQVVQGDTSGFVVSRKQVTEFGKSTLSVEKTETPPADEIPLAREAAGGPYLAYRNAGVIVRLGDSPARLSAGGPIGDPVVTAAGDLWLFRTTTGLLCKVAKGADRISSCPAKAPERHTGALTLVDDRPQFVDTSAGTLHPVDDNGLGEARSLGVRTSATSRPAANDVSGRVAILDPADRAMHLVDAAGPGREPVTVPLQDGDYDGPASTGSVVVLVDRTSDTVLTYDEDGRQRDTKALPKGNGHPRLAQGEDHRVYVDGAEGTHVAVVDEQGKVADVPVVGRPAGPDQKAAEPQSQTDPRANQAEEDREPPQRPAVEPARPPAAPATEPPATEPPPPRPPPRRPNPPPPPTVPATVPGAPGAVSAAAGDGSATVSWREAADNRSPITGYLVSWQGGSLTAGPDARGVTVPNLTNGVRYTIAVAAVNRVGTGPAVEANPVTPVAPVGPPGMPQNLAIDATTKHVDATVTWSAAAANGAPITAYRVAWRRDDGSRAGSATVSGTTLSHVIEEIWAGKDVPFTVTVIAVNSAGQGPPASAHKAPPAAQPEVTVTRGGPGEWDGCDPGSCYLMRVQMDGFEPETRYQIVPHSSHPTYENEGKGWTTDEEGSASFEAFDYDGSGTTVWVVVTTADGEFVARSADYHWE